MIDKTSQIEELKKRVLYLNFEKYAKLDAIHRRFCLFITHFFGEDSEYLGELAEIDFPESVTEPIAALEDYLNTRKQRWLSHSHARMGHGVPSVIASITSSMTMQDQRIVACSSEKSRIIL